MTPHLWAFPLAPLSFLVHRFRRACVASQLFPGREPGLESHPMAGWKYPYLSASEAVLGFPEELLATPAFSERELHRDRGGDHPPTVAADPWVAGWLEM